MLRLKLVDFFPLFIILQLKLFLNFSHLLLKVLLPLVFVEHLDDIHRGNAAGGCAGADLRACF